MAAEIDLWDLSDALDEVWRLRRALAYEAEVTRAHYEGYKTFPKTRRKVAEEQVGRMKSAARGEAQVAYAGTADHSLRGAMRDAGAEETLTMNQWLSRPGRSRQGGDPRVTDQSEGRP